MLTGKWENDRKMKLSKSEVPLQPSNSFGARTFKAVGRRGHGVGRVGAVQQPRQLPGLRASQWPHTRFAAGPVRGGTS